jgi:hypothetical protein
MNSEVLKGFLLNHASAVKTHWEAAQLEAVGKRVRVVSDFNGQPYGRSRASLRGQILIIDSVHLYDDGRVSFCGHREDGRWLDAGFGINDIEFLEE